MSYLLASVSGPWQIFSIRGIHSFIQKIFILSEVDSVLGAEQGKLVLSSLEASFLRAVR